MRGRYSAVRQWHCPACGVDGRDQIALRSKVRLDEPFDLAHARTNALLAQNVKRSARAQSLKPECNRINSPMARLASRQS
jgi:hypothetical protein